MNFSFGKVQGAAGLVAIAVTIFLTAGCTGARTSAAASQTPSARVVHPSGSATVGCPLARAVGPDTPPPGADDLAFGPLVFTGLANGYNFRPAPSPDPDGVTFFKIGAEMTSDATATVSIGHASRAYAGIVTEMGPSAGYSSVTYIGCPSSKQPGPVFWVGGFSLVGRDSACVPLTVQVDGEAQPHHLVLPIESGSCPQ